MTIENGQDRPTDEKLLNRFDLDIPMEEADFSPQEE